MIGCLSTLRWSSSPEEQATWTSHLDEDLFFVFVPRDGKAERDVHLPVPVIDPNTIAPGYTVVYVVRPEVLPLALGKESCYPFCQNQLIIACTCLFLLALVFIPPFVCASITKRVRRNETPDLPLIDKRPDSEMIRSGNTDTTQASIQKFVAKRSIGIQLSAHGTPRTNRAADTPLPFGSSAASVLDELEYDDYDGTRDPGSLLAPPLHEPYSTIDIEQIIAEARKIVEHVEQSDAHTQI
ncbi:unnamed protein product, partial [Mesorhabditis spiculigera]